MSAWIFAHLRWFFAEFGYGAVAVLLLLENAGLPVPGETALLFASFLAFSEHALRLPWIIAVGTVAATIGDNVGYAIGRHGGRRLLDRYRHIFRIPERTIHHGERLFARHGALTVFFARFIFGLRVIAGPLAGVLRMEWRKFALFNFLGATVWVTVIAMVGYLFGSQWERLVRFVGRADLVIAILAAIALAWIIWRYRRERRAEE